MIPKKYIVGIERENFVCKENGAFSKIEYSNFLKSKNNFISESVDKRKLIIKSPLCNDVGICYDKIEEIINVIYMELHKSNMLIWPFNREKDNKGESRANLKISFFMDESFLKVLGKNGDERDYLSFKKNLNDGKWLLCQILYGLSFRYDKDSETFFDFIEDFNIEELINIKVDKNFVELSFGFLDLFDKCGIKKLDLSFLVCFIFSCMLFEDGCYCNKNRKLIEGFSVECEERVKNVVKKLIELDGKYNFGCRDGLEELYKIFDKELSKSSINVYKNNDFILKMTKRYYEDSFSSRYVIKRYPKLDGSAVALIKDALSQGIDFNIVDETKSFIEFIHDDHKEIVVMATMTNRDSYILSYITDDKQFAKNILAENGLIVPNGVLLDAVMNPFDSECAINCAVGKAVVVKPKSTNSGTGITIFSFPASEKEIFDAVKYAFRYDAHVIIEDFIKGNEYRFLVVDDECVGVVHRRSASVVGDGKLTIKELIDLKNQEPWHALLENQVVEDKIAEDFLNRNGYTFDSVPENSRRVFLRENSNCSTGGECIDVTDDMPEFFKKKAVLAAKCFNAKIAGVDIIIDDLNSEKYAIIEINDNPGYALNEWPYEGKGEKIGLYILKMLGF